MAPSLRTVLTPLQIPPFLLHEISNMRLEGKNEATGKFLL